MNKKFIFSIFLLFVLTIAMVGSVNAAVNADGTEHSSIISWITSLFDDSTYDSQAPQILVTPNQGYVGDEFTIYGKGFRINEEDILVRFDTIILGTIDADSNGNFVFETNVPNIPYNKYVYTIEVVDSNGYSIFDQFAIFQGTQPIKPTIFVNPDEGYVGDEFTVYGYNFTENAADILIRFEDEILGYTSSDSNGNFFFETNVPMPVNDQTYYLIEVVDINGYSVFDTFTILWGGPELTLIATPDEGYVGDVIGLAGTGYIPGDNLIILFDTEIIVTASMGASGSFDTTFVVPDLAPGDYIINVYGTNMSSAYDVFEAFTILEEPDNSEIFVNPNEGYAGDIIDVWGNDFGPNETLTIYLDGVVIATPDTDGNGSFSSTFIVPSITPGLYEITVDGYNASTYFLVLEDPTGDPQIYVAPTSGEPGDVVVIAGINFGPNETLVIYLGSSVIVMPTTDTYGAFITTFIVPDWSAGDYEITVAGYNVSEWFTIEEVEEEEEEDDDFDDDEEEARPNNYYYMESLSCNFDEVQAGDVVTVSFEVVNIGESDEENMIISVWNEELGINIVIEDVTIERGEPNLIQIDVPIPVNADIGQYSLMIELYPEHYGYDYINRVTDSINVVVGNAYSPDDVEVVFLSTPGNNEVEGQNSVSAWMFVSGIALLVLIVFFIFKVTALLRA